MESSDERVSSIPDCSGSAIDRATEKSSSTSITTIDRLPLEILFDILSRLPIDSLANARYVCKTWHSIIVSDLHFAKTIFFRSKIRPSSVFVHHDSEFFSLMTPDGRFVPLRSGFKDVPEVVAACDGIILYEAPTYSLWRSCFLYNPFLGERLQLPDPWYIIQENLRRDYSYGFGRDPFTGDYKIVRVNTYLCIQNYAEITTVVFNDDGSCSVHDDCWRVKGMSLGGGEHSDNVVYKMSPGLFLGSGGSSTLSRKHLFRRLHWMGIRLCQKKTAIVSFDLHEETFELLDCPVEIEGNDGKVDICDLQSGRLSVYSSRKNGLIDIWEMEEYGNQDSWMKKHTINFQHCCRYKGKDRFSPQFIWNGGLLFLRGPKAFVVYDPESETAREVPVRGPYFEKAFLLADNLLYMRRPSSGSNDEIHETP